MADAVERLRVGIIGTGRISDLHAAGYVTDPRAEIAAVCDVDADTALTRARSWGAEPQTAYTDWRELLADDSLDAVEVLLPHHMHLEVGLAAVASGKHVSTQKPVGFTVAESRRFAAAANEATAGGQVIRVVENFLSYPPVERLLEVVRNGDIGDVISVRQKSLSGDPAFGWKIPAGAVQWRLDLERNGGGPLVFDDGIHKFSIFWALLGVADSVHAWIGETEVEGGIIDAPSQISLRWPGGAIGNMEVVNAPELQVMSRHYAQEDRVEVTGSKGVAWMNRGHGRLIEEAPVRVYADGEVTEYVDIESGWDISFVRATRDFIDAVHDGGTATLTADEHVEVLSTALAALQSARDGRDVRPAEVG